ncbi:MAG: A/G-specific adenine glycosylase [Rhodanobacteraceae bacterium]|jgi:A/G-specific adenine glycosylase|nr:A/G-specific adenine glycosylase [Rhodanobacteraceae bacterium]MBL0027596.1 A/G-specific adenine glycosylase [Rhodanobacteraceae bacterium]MBP9155399.1 A/G-specific adenine glycosylase [Xanthomonadales bacterium]HQW81522.1 A/G-specific adenine glycosylase [Pseudomonadota bacterium]
MTDTDFAARLLRWFDAHGRHDLPWQQARSPYRVWLSEVMLQQTQVTTVIPYFERFVTRFPDLATLAAATVDEVLSHWSGLGYYSRGRNLHRAAQRCTEHHSGELPNTLDELVALPGIGRSTAAAILAQAHHMRAAILDGNVKRVLARHRGVSGFPGQSTVERQLWAIAESRLPDARISDYTQALMDLGATVCTPKRPNCVTCPLRKDCVALATDCVALLPTPKARKVTPTRRIVMLVLVDRDGQVLFERRPPSGIWGGLLGLPEFDTGEAAERELATRWKSTTAPCRGAVYRHVFTHFKLDIEPLTARLDSAVAVADANHEWHRPERFVNLALPTAIRRVLDRALRSA